MTTPSSLDALVVVPPLSPSDTNPPLGPYLLKTCFENAGLVLSVCDLSVQYINRFKSGTPSMRDATLGDQDKDRQATHAARRHFIKTSPLMDQPAIHVPCCGDAILGMHFSFDAVQRALTDALARDSFWKPFLREHVFNTVKTPPRILGLSIMGTPQVFVALLLARMAKTLWPDALIVAGGSHITLLQHEIRSDARYGKDIDLFMPGHCEGEFVLLAQALRQGRVPRGIGIRAGQGALPDSPKLCATPLTINRSPRRATPDFELLPALTQEDLRLYDALRVTLPMQLTRGCAYGRCAYCTYPAVEPEVNTEPDWTRAMAAISELVARTGIRRFSFKDSLFTSSNLRRLADRLYASGIAIEWSATTLLNRSLTPALFRVLAKAGLRTLEVGLETIDPVGQALFDKRFDVSMVEQVLADAADAGIVIVINQILGWPGQTRESAERQLAWYERMRARWPQHIQSSFNMLEINRASPMALAPGRFGIDLAGIAPWAFSHSWNAPAWRPALQVCIQTPDVQPASPEKEPLMHAFC